MSESESDETPIGTRVTITPCVGPNKDKVLHGTFKGNIPSNDFECLMPWMIADNGEGYLGYECWWGEVTTEEESVGTALVASLETLEAAALQSDQTKQ